MKSIAWQNRIKKVWDRLADKNAQRQVSVFKELGIQPIWCDDFDKDIPELVDHILKP